MAMIKIALDAGHGLSTPGKRCLKSLDPNETREWWLNNRVANYAEEYLKEYDGYALLRVDDRTGKVDIPLGTRTRNANNWGATIYISIHHNAGINGGTGGGISVFVYPKIGNPTKQYQKDIYEYLMKETGLKGNRASPLSEANFQVLRETRMPAILIEGGFMDSRTDVPIILSERFGQQYARAITNFLVDTFKLNSIEKPTENNDKVKGLEQENKELKEKIERIRNIIK